MINRKWISAAACAAALAAAPSADAQIKKVLVTDFIFGSVHAAGRPKNLELIQLLGTEMGFTVEVASTEGKITADYLKGFDLVVWNNLSQNGLQAAATKSVWQTYLEGGGALLSLHASGDTRTGTWPWYMEGLMDATYQIHSAVEAADVWIHGDAIAVNGQFHPVLKNQGNFFKKYAVTVGGAPTQKWATVWTDEWYVFPKDPNPATKDLTVLLELDEFNTRGVTNWNPNETKTGYHPMSWTRENIGAGKGRLVFLVTGHDDKIHAARDKGLKELWKNSMLWATKRSTGCKDPAAANYNQWADKDETPTLCTGVTSIDLSRPVGMNAAVTAHASGVSIPFAGRFQVVLRTLAGRDVHRENLACPCESRFDASLPRGVYSLSLAQDGRVLPAGYTVTRP
jgi:hypothetical protein